MNIDLRDVSVVAGHFFWDVWKALPSMRSSDSPSVFVMGRHPVTRAISYYYQRCYILEQCLGYQRHLNELSEEELRAFLLGRRAEVGADGRTYVVVDEGIEDAACRVLSNEKHHSGLLVHELIGQVFPKALPLSDQSIQQAFSHTELAVVGLLEDWRSTVRVLNFWFPWLDVSRDFRVIGDERMLHVAKEDLNTLRPELIRVIEQANTCDMELYRRMKIQFQKLLNFVDFHDLQSAR